MLDIHPLLLGNPATVFFGFDFYPELHSCQNTALAAASPFLGGATYFGVVCRRPQAHGMVRAWLTHRP